MKLLKKLFCWAIILVSLFIMQDVKALDAADFKIEPVMSNEGAITAAIDITISGEFEDEAMYRVKFVNEGDPKPTIPSNWDGDIDGDAKDITKWKTVQVNSDYSGAKIHIDDDWYMLDGYDYAYLLKCTQDSCEITEEPIKVTRPALPSLGERYQLYFLGLEQGNTLSVFPLFPDEGENGSHKLNIKVGIINDNNLLYSVYKREAGSMANLLNYAKNHSGTSYVLSQDNKFNVPISNLEVVNGAYYYVYTDYENSDGLYRDLSDVAVAMAKGGNIVNDVEWNFDDTANSPSGVATTTQVKAQNPKTSDLNTNVIIVAFVVCIGLIIISKKKLSKN